MFRSPKLLLVGLALALPAFLNGCASVVRGTKDTLVVESDPVGANVRLSTGQVGKTPTSFHLPRKHDLEVFIEKDGYEPLAVHVSAQISGAGGVGLAGNVLIGGVIGLGVDTITGASKDLRPNPIKVTMVPLKKEEKPVPAPEPPPVAATPTVVAPVAAPEARQP